MTVKQISVFLENKPGKLAEFTDVLSDNKIDMRALSLAEARRLMSAPSMQPPPISTMTISCQAKMISRQRATRRAPSSTLVR